MRKIIYLPLEHIDMRYTTYMDEQIMEYMNRKVLDYRRIYPQLDYNPKLQKGQFLNAGYTMQFKTLQLATIAKMYIDDTINDGDVIFCSDLWFPGIEMIGYLNHFYKKKIKLRGILHAGSFTDTDEVRSMERWAKSFEEAVFDIADKVFVASNFMKKDLVQKRLISSNKVVVTPFNLDYANLNKYKMRGDKKANIIVFNGRHHAEKQPLNFESLRRQFQLRDWLFVDTHAEQLPKEEYYKLLSRAKVVVSFALQENFGFGIAEAVYLGCIPIVPNRLVYPEMYEPRYLYNNWNGLVEILKEAMSDSIRLPNTSKMKMSDVTMKKWLVV